MIKVKAVQWSYPTSPNAKAFGFYKTGCWCVELYESDKLPIAIAGFAKITQAKAFAEKMQEPWSKYTR